MSKEETKELDIQPIYDKYLKLAFMSLGFFIVDLYLGYRFIIWDIPDYLAPTLNNKLVGYFIMVISILASFNLYFWSERAVNKVYKATGVYNPFCVFKYLRIKQFVSLPFAILFILCFEIALLVYKLLFI